MNLFLTAAIFAAVLGMYQFGYNTGNINAPEAEIKKFLSESYYRRYNEVLGDASSQTYFSVIVSMFVVGGLFGSLSGGYIADRFGRKQGILYTQFFSILGAILMGCSKQADSYEMLIIGRLIIGLACGLFTGLSPLYVAEIAPTHIRGAMGTVNQLAVTSGILTSMILGPRTVLGGPNSWPTLLALTAVPAILQCVILPFMPETPRYLILSKGNIEDGKKALKKLRNTDNVRSEIEELQNEEANKGSNDASFSMLQLLTSSKLRLSLFVCICLHLSQQLSGIVAIFYYSTSFFNAGGITGDNSQYATIGVGCIMVTMTLVTIPLMDRVGRRTLHLVGLAGIIVCSIMITIAFNYSSQDKENNTDDNKGVDVPTLPNLVGNKTMDNNEVKEESATNVGIFLVFATLLFVVFFALGPGSIPWMAAGEMFSQGPRAPAISVCVFTNWLANLIVSLVFPQLQIKLLTYSFVPFLLIIVILFCILSFYFVETKGKTADEVAQIYQTQNAWTTFIGSPKNSTNIGASKTSRLELNTSQL